jgi:hypothetical protein
VARTGPGRRNDEHGARAAPVSVPRGDEAGCARGDEACFAAL